MSHSLEPNAFHFACAQLKFIRSGFKTFKQV